MKRHGPFLALCLMALSAGFACNELNNFPPAAPGPVPLPRPSQFNIVGHWEALTDQGRRVAFDVTPQGMVTNTRINLHHDCSAARLRITVDGLEAQVSTSSFLGTTVFRIDDGGNIYVAKVTLSGRFESDTVMRGGFVSSITDKPPNDIYGVCFAVNGTFDGYRDP